jgi:formylglycine-generating enzyme required for sulfatase activity
MSLLMAITITSTTFGQSAGLAKQVKSYAEAVDVENAKPNPKASDVLNEILTKAKEGITPIEIYPPGYFEWLESFGEEPMFEMMMFDPGASALTAGDKANMSWIQPGTFTMGSPTSEALRDSSEVQHQVTITSGFYIGKYEVTQGEYLAIVGNNPSYFTPANSYSEDLNRPVENVSWYDATNYCHLLTQQELTAGRIPSGWVFRLPTESEWEYACRAGTSTAFNFGNVIQGGDANFDTRYTYSASSGEAFVSSPSIPPLNRTTTVGNYVDNAWGLYDMHGNVWEWCQDRYGSYPTGSVIDPQGPTSGANRVIRGGYWEHHGYFCRSAVHEQYIPSATGSAVGFRIVLAPTTPGWYQAITTTPSQPTYANCVAKGSGKSNLILATHGWNPPWADLTWLTNMTNSIQQYLAAHSQTSWQVEAYTWVDNASTGITPSAAQKALENARQEGKKLGDCIAVQGWTHVHLVSHSAGAGLIQAVCERIKAISPSTTVHCTFLDPFVGLDYAGISRYGNGADWAENYFSRDAKTHIGGWITEGPFTESLLTHAYNVDVTPLDPNKTVGAKFRSSATGQMEPCVKTWTTHQWPIVFYTNTVVGNVTSEYGGFGFPQSKEGGGWSSGVPSYTPGNNPAAVLGTPDPTCTTDVQVTPPSYVNTLIDFTQSPTIQSDTGTIQKWLDSIKLTTGSPAWLATVVASTNPVNTLSFDTKFTSTNGAQGLLTVLWDDQAIGIIDERVSATNSYTFRFPNAVANSSHILGFRLDPFTNVQSVVTITNITLNQVGVSQPFSLLLTGGTTNGALIYRLTGEAGFEYHIQASTNLVDWEETAVLQNTNGVVNFFDQSSTNHSMRFYRGVASY